MSFKKKLFLSLCFGIIITLLLLYNIFIQDFKDAEMIGFLFWSPLYIFVFSALFYKLLKWKTK